MPQSVCHGAQHAQRQAVGADADLKAPRAEPRLIERPTVAHFAEHLRFMHAAVFKDQLAGLGPGNRRNAAYDAITGRSGVDQKTSYSFAPFRSWQAREQLDEVRDIGEGREHLRAVDFEIVAARRRRGLHHRRISAGSGLAQTERRSFFAADAGPEIFVDLLAFAVEKNI